MPFTLAGCTVRTLQEVIDESDVRFFTCKIAIV